MIGKSLDDAKSWVQKAVSFYRIHGKEKSLAEFSNPEGLFRQEEMYIFAMTLSGIVVAHGIDQEHIGRDFCEISDYNGKKYFVEVVEIANSEGSGLVEYWWINPSSHHIEPKELYFEKVQDLIICSGVYL